LNQIGFWFLYTKDFFVKSPEKGLHKNLSLFSLSDQPQKRCRKPEKKKKSNLYSCPKIFKRKIKKEGGKK